VEKINHRRARKGKPRRKEEYRYCEGVGSWRIISTTTTSLGEEVDFAVHASVYGKVQAEPNAYN
jgi:hypothetical protein